jgi:glycerol-3-phosphate dehydrogenase
MAGGKLTTYRLMARELVGRAVRLLRRRGLAGRSARRCRTRKRPLPGARDLPRGRAPFQEVAARIADQADQQGGYELEPEPARHLADTYGSRAPGVLGHAAGPADLTPLCPSQPVLRVEVDHAALMEQAATVEDFLARRSQLLLRAPQQALQAAPEVAERLGRHLGWDAARRDREVERFAREVRGSLACKLAGKDEA